MLAMAPAQEEAAEALLAPSNSPIGKEKAETGMDKPQMGAWAIELRHVLVLSAPAIVQLSTQQALFITNQVRCKHSPALAILAIRLSQVCHRRTAQAGQAHAECGMSECDTSVEFPPTFVVLRLRELS